MGLNAICVINIFSNILTKLACEGGDCWVWVTGFVVGQDQYSLDERRNITVIVDHPAHPLHPTTVTNGKHAH